MDRNYYSYAFLGHYETRKKGLLFSHKVKVLIPFLFFEQDGKYFEFFSNYYLGTCDVPLHVGDKNHIIHVPESTLEIPLSFCYPSECTEAKRLTPVEFAEEAKKHLPYKSQILPVISDYFNKKHQEWLTVQHKAAERESAKRDAEKWLDSVIK